MGLALENAVKYTFRPRSWDLHQVYDAADGEVLYHVYMRRKGPTYWPLRWLYHVATFLRRDVQNPTQLEFQGEFKSADRAEGYCLAVERMYPGAYAFEVCPFAVNRVFPLEPVRWHGSFRPGATRREKPLEGQKLFLVLEESEFRAQLTAARTQGALDCECGGANNYARLSRRLDELQSRLEDIESRLAALEKGGGIVSGIGAT
jgi:hypothetical protein